MSLVIISVRGRKTMKKTSGRFFILFFLLFTAQVYAEQEDSAQLIFSKTSSAQRSTHIYTVQPGDVLSAIIRRLPGITEKDIPRYYQMTKELNPGMSNLDRLYTGQKIILPGASPDTPESSPSDISAEDDTLLSDESLTRPYQVKRGDSLIRIVHRELNIKNRTQKTLLLIKSLNPDIKNVNQIYIGQRIRLPEKSGVVKIATAHMAASSSPAEEKPVLPRMPSEEKLPVVLPPQEPSVLEDKTLQAKDAVVLPPEARLAVIKKIITQMNGNMITNGNYYLPISRTEQLTVDCSIIPIVELDDRTTIFLDLNNRSSQHLKKIISDHWNNYQLVKIDSRDDIIVMLKKIINNSKAYEIIKAQKPLAVESRPPLEITVDWIISKKGAASPQAKTQGLRMVHNETPLLPRAVINAARTNSIIITEISPDKGLVAKPDEIYSLPPIPVLPKSTARDFAHALLAYLNIEAEIDADIQIFNIARDGFNLSVKADLVVTRGDKKKIFFSRNLPPQFVSILEKSGNELFYLSDTENPAQNMEVILRAFHFAYASGYFTFSGPDKNQPPYSFGFSGTKIKTNQDIYVVNFDFSPELRGLLQETWLAHIVCY